jgi:hypothetical protein
MLSPAGVALLEQRSRIILDGLAGYPRFRTRVTGKCEANGSGNGIGQGNSNMTTKSPSALS